MSQNIEMKLWRQSMKKWLLLTGFAGASVLFAILSVNLVGVGGLMRPEVPIWAKALILGGAALFIVGVLVLMRWHWQLNDEAVREAHKSAWFWGGSCGLLLILPLAAAFVLTKWTFYGAYLSFLRLGSGFGEFTAGFITAMLCMMIGYAIAWAWWWWKRR